METVSRFPIHPGACAGTCPSISANPYKTNHILHVPDTCQSRFPRLLTKKSYDLRVPAMCQKQFSRTLVKPIVFFISGLACARTCQHMPQLDGQLRKSALAHASMWSHGKCPRACGHMANAPFEWIHPESIGLDHCVYDMVDTPKLRRRASRAG